MSKRSKIFIIIGSIILLFFLIMAIFPQIFTSYGLKQSFSVYEPASFNHILGTNDVGYDVFTELIYSSRISLVVGITSSIFSLILGIIFGVIFSLNKVLKFIGDVVGNVFLALPRLILIMVISSYINANLFNIILIISLFTWQTTAKLIANNIEHIKSKPFYESYLNLGYSKFHLAIYHIIPNLKDIIITRFLLGITSSILLESTLSFLGFGDLYQVSWGRMMNFAFNRGAIINNAYLYLISPGIMIALLSLSFYLINIGLSLKREEVTRTNL